MTRSEPNEQTLTLAPSERQQGVWRWRGVPIMDVALLVAGPLLMGIVLVMALFRLNLQAVRAGYPPRVQAWLPTAFAIAYVFSALAAGRWVSARRATVVLLTAVSLAGFAALVVPLMGDLGWMLVLAAGVGLVAGPYAVAFQVNLRNVQPFHTLAWSIACFNASWALGDASGPALVGTVGLWPMEALAAVLLVLTAMHMSLIGLTARSPHATVQVHMATEIPSTPRLRLVGWVSIFLSTLVYVALVATLYPGLGVDRGWSDQQIAMGVVALAFPVAVTSVVWAKWRRLLRSPAVSLVNLALLGVALASLPWLESWWVVSTSLVLAGLALGGVAFSAVYYANADPETPGRSVGINEAAAGLGAMLGPVVIGALAWDDFTAVRAYVGPGGLLMVVAAVMGIWWVCRGRRESCQVPMYLA